MDKKYVIVGIQGSGKGTQAQRLCADFDLSFIGFGDLLRWHIKNNTIYGKRVKDLMAQGKLVDDRTVEELIARRLDIHDHTHGFLLDGFPRNEGQRKFLFDKYKIDGCLYLHIENEEEVVQRMLARKSCPKCGTQHNLINVPKVENKCNNCGATLNQRGDDNEKAIRQRLADYHNETEPTLEWYDKHDMLYKVDATGEIDDVYGRILDSLGLEVQAK